MAIEIVDFPIKHCDLPVCYGTVYQRVVLQMSHKKGPKILKVVMISKDIYDIYM